MINIPSVRYVYIIGESRRHSVIKDRFKTMFDVSKIDPGGFYQTRFYSILTDDITPRGDTNRGLMRSLRPLYREVDDAWETAIQQVKEREGIQDGQVFAEHSVDPGIVFLIDSSNKAAAAFARLLQGPWGGHPASKVTLVY